MKALITGAAGFIGEHLLRHIRGYDLCLVDKQYKTDARDFFRRSGEHFDLVVHLAALVGGRALIEASPLAYAENLELDAGLFRWAERTRPGRVIYVSSVAAYPRALQYGMDSAVTPDRLRERPDPRMLREDDISLDSPGMPDQVYGWAKLTGEMLAARSSVPVSVPRPFTVYGEDQDPVFPFASLLKQVRERRDPVTIWGSGNQVRDFIHVSDVALGILAMAEQRIDGPVNFCTGRATSLNELARMMADAAGYSPQIEHLDKTEGLPYRVGDPGRLHEFRSPAVSLEEGIRRAL